MSAKTSAEVVIGGKVYTLCGYEEEEYLQKVAIYINNKIQELDENEDVKRLSTQMKSTLLELNIADDYFKAKDLVQKLENNIEAKEKEVYDLKHILISNQKQSDEDQEMIKRLKEENKELLLNKERLEKVLEEQLLENDN
ncbi:cell division protein ZapA [Lachnobacterium bovis]|uniref:Cell division protein ZapA n=1 Tax=Lachnobacterium bovis DSM 14045 TaxID=1122142 RepID=A0A1H3FQF1_9FIRM|nr:cell division protein ZapA [Lachnobacterium bovis]MBQ1802777.1 cell division protein ZapA [Lachnobacterium sp.]SDX92374.1 cell division protein ZapA [Lachnobacterium bovis DSM 14045]